MRKAKPAPLPRWAPSEWLDLVGAILLLGVAVALNCRGAYGFLTGEGFWDSLAYLGAAAGALALAGRKD